MNNNRNAPDDRDELALTVSGAAMMLRLSKAAVYRLIGNGELPVIEGMRPVSVRYGCVCRYAENAARDAATRPRRFPGVR